MLCSIWGVGPLTIGFNEISQTSRASVELLVRDLNNIRVKPVECQSSIGSLVTIAMPCSSDQSRMLRGARCNKIPPICGYASIM